MEKPYFCSRAVIRAFMSDKSPQSYDAVSGIRVTSSQYALYSESFPVSSIAS